MAATDVLRCEKTDLLIRQCAHCRGKNAEDPRRLQRSEISTPFEAKYPGACSICDKSFRKGATVAFVRGRDKEIAGPCCVPASVL